MKKKWHQNLATWWAVVWQQLFSSTQTWLVSVSLTTVTPGPSTVPDTKVHQYLSDAWTNECINELDLKAKGKDRVVFSLAKNSQGSICKLSSAESQMPSVTVSQLFWPWRLVLTLSKCSNLVSHYFRILFINFCVDFPNQVWEPGLSRTWLKKKDMCRPPEY